MNIEAIVIRKMALREHDQRVVLYSREIGKMTAVARGSLRLHSKQALALDDGNVIQCELVRGKSAQIMTAALAVRAYSSAKSSPLRWATMQFFLQAVDALVYDEQPDVQLWSCLTSILMRLDEAADSEALSVFRWCQGHLLEVLGYGVRQGTVSATASLTRIPMDEQFEAIAQRRLTALDLLYEVAAG